MPLLFKPVQNTIKSGNGKKKFRLALVKFKRRKTTRDVSKKLAAISAQSEGDIYNILINLGIVLGDYLMDSNSVYLENLGTFTLIAKTTGNSVDTPEEVSPKQVKSLRVQFTPAATRNGGSGLTRAMLDGIRYERYGSQADLISTVEDTEGGNGDDDDPTA